MDESTNTTTKPKRNGKKTDRIKQYNLERMSKKQRIKSPTAKDNNNPPSNSIKSLFQKQTKQTSNNKSDGDGDDGDNKNNKSTSSNDAVHSKARNDIIAKAKYVKSTPFEERLNACIAPADLLTRGKGIHDYKKKTYSYSLLKEHLTESEYSDVVNYKNPDSSDEDSEDDKEKDMVVLSNKEAASVADMDKELISIDGDGDSSEDTGESDDDDSSSDDDIKDEKPAALTMEIEMGTGVTKSKTIVLPPGSMKKR